MLPLRNSACHVCWKGMFARHKSDWAEGFFFFSLFRSTVAPYLSNTSEEERGPSHVQRHRSSRLLEKSRPAIHKTHGIAETRLGNQSLSPPEIVLTLALILECYRCGWRKRLERKILCEVSSRRWNWTFPFYGFSQIPRLLDPDT